MRETRALARLGIHACSSEPIVTRRCNKNHPISCAGWSTVKLKCDENFIVDHCFIFLLSMIIWIVNIPNIVWAHISRLVSVLVIQINSECLFLTIRLKTTTCTYRYTGSYLIHTVLFIQSTPRRWCESSETAYFGVLLSLLYESSTPEHVQNNKQKWLFNSWTTKVAIPSLKATQNRKWLYWHHSCKSFLF